MEFEEIKSEYRKILNQLAEMTGRTIQEVEDEVNNAENMEELLKRATEIFNE